GVAALLESATGKTAGDLAAALQQATNSIPCPSDTSAYDFFPAVDNGAPQTCQGGAGHNSWYGSGQVDALKAVGGEPPFCGLAGPPPCTGRPDQARVALRAPIPPRGANSRVRLARPPFARATCTVATLPRTRPAAYVSARPRRGKGVDGALTPQEW